MSDEKRLEYALRLRWDGNLGEGTTSYAAYGRGFVLGAEGKPELEGSADPAFRGEVTRYSPEELLLGAISACHMLFLLALCARSGIPVLRYSDRPTGTLRLEADGGGRFERVLLRPSVTVAPGTAPEQVGALSARSGELCFIARSCAFPIHHELHVDVEGS